MKLIKITSVCLLTVFCLCGCRFKNYDNLSNPFDVSDNQSSEESDRQSDTDMSSDNAAGKPSAQNPLPNTTWVLSYAVDSNGNKIDASRVESYIGNVVLHFQSSSACSVSVMNNSLSCGYSLHGKTLNINNGDFTGTVSDSSITVSYDNMKIVLKKQTG